MVEAWVGLKELSGHTTSSRKGAKRAVVVRVGLSVVVANSE